jgi:hypothetical protein
MKRNFISFFADYFKVKPLGLCFSSSFSKLFISLCSFWMDITWLVGWFLQASASLLGDFQDTTHRLGLQRIEGIITFSYFILGIYLANWLGFRELVLRKYPQISIQQW